MLIFFTTEVVFTDIFKIRTFVRAVELGSLSKAANELSYAPSALSHMVVSIEGELGLNLIKRTFAGIELTENGEQMMPLFQSLLKAEDNMFSKAKELSGQTVIKIGTYSSISKTVLPKIIKEFNLLYPKYKISIIVSDKFSTKFNDLDIVFSDKLKNSEYEWVPLMEDEYVAVTGRDIPVKEIALKDLNEHPFIMPQDSAVKKFCEGKLTDVIEISSDDDTSIISMVQEGIGNTILPRLSVNTKIHKVCLTELSPKLSRTIGITYDKDNISYSAKRFVQFVKGRQIDMF